MDLTLSDFTAQLASAPPGAGCAEALPRSPGHWRQA